MKECKCSSNEFITQLNSYDLYQVVDGKLKFQKSEIINEKTKFFCRECGTERKM